MLQDVALGARSLADYTHLVGAGPGRGDPRARRAAGGQAGSPRQRDRVRRRRLGDPLHAGAADAGRRTRRPLAGDPRPGGVLQRHQADAQLAAGRSAGDHRPAVGGVRGLQRDERAEPRRRLGRDHRPRPAAGGAAGQRPRPGADLDLALPHRPLDAQRGDAGAPAAAPARLRRDGLAHGAVRPGRHRRQRRGSSRRRSTRCRRRTWRSPPRTRPSSASSSGSTSSAR